MKLNDAEPTDIVETSDHHTEENDSNEAFVVAIGAVGLIGLLDTDVRQP